MVVVSCGWGSGPAPCSTPWPSLVSHTDRLAHDGTAFRLPLSLWVSPRQPKPTLTHPHLELKVLRGRWRSFGIRGMSWAKVPLKTPSCPADINHNNRKSESIIGVIATQNINTFNSLVTSHKKLSSLLTMFSGHKNLVSCKNQKSWNNAPNVSNPGCLNSGCHGNNMREKSLLSPVGSCYLSSRWTGDHFRVGERIKRRAGVTRPVVNPHMVPAQRFLSKPCSSSCHLYYISSLLASNREEKAKVFCLAAVLQGHKRHPWALASRGADSHQNHQSSLQPPESGGVWRPEPSVCWEHSPTRRLLPWILSLQPA